MKNFRIVLGVAIILFIIGFWGSGFMIDATEKILDRKIMVLTLWGGFAPGVHLGLLLAFCSVSAGVLQWAYSKNRSSNNSILVFFFGLFISIAIAGIGILLNLLQAQNLLVGFGDKLNKSVSLSAESIDYLGWGFWPIFWIYGIVTLAFLWVSHQKQNRE